MDLTLSLSSDWFNLLSLPLIFLTLKDVIPRWRSIWDDKLTMEDRRLLMRMVVFLALPLVVFIHELGHLLAALGVGAKVYEFHYGPVAGHVTVDSNLAADKLLWIAFAGNLAQIMVGLISLVMAAVVRSAPLVAFLVYLGLFAIGDTVIFYAALSLASIYGDWIQIYQSPCTNLVFEVGVVHVFLIALVVYCLCAMTPRLWFTKKTMPGWSSKHERLVREVQLDQSEEKIIAVVNSCLEAGLLKQAEQYINMAKGEAAASPWLDYARAEIKLARNDIDGARQLFEKIAANRAIGDEMRAGLLLQIGELWLHQNNTHKALQYFDSARSIDETQGDARLHSVILKASMNHYDGLEKELEALKGEELHWVYRRNQESAPAEITRLEALCARQPRGGKA